MPLVRFTWIDAAIIGGGIILTGVVVAAVVKAKPPEKEIPPIVPPDEIPWIPTPGIPATIEFPVYPTSLSQLYGFYYTMRLPAAQILEYKALTSFRGPPYPEGQVIETAKLRVVDAAGRGVPNVAVLIWSVPTRDDQSGRLIINNSLRSEAEPLRLVTDGTGQITLNLTYLLMNIKVLEDNHSFGCCMIVGRVHDIDVGQGCALPLTGICYKAKEAQTAPRVYTVNARIEGTVKTGGFVVSCQAVGKALW